MRLALNYLRRILLDSENAVVNKDADEDVESESSGSEMSETSAVELAELAQHEEGLRVRDPSSATFLLRLTISSFLWGA